jgi:hypothetical protein
MGFHVRTPQETPQSQSSFIVSLPNVADLEPFDLFATEIIPAVEQIEVTSR